MEVFKAFSQNSLESPGPWLKKKKTHSQAPSLEILIPHVWYGAQKFGFLTSASGDSSYQGVSLSNGTHCQRPPALRVSEALIKT